MNDFLRKMSEIGRIEVEREDSGPRLQELDEEAEAALLLGCQRSTRQWQIRVARWLYAGVITAAAVVAGALVVAGDEGVGTLLLAAALGTHAALAIRAPNLRRDWRRPAAAYGAAFILAFFVMEPDHAMNAMLSLPAAAVAVAGAGWWLAGEVLNRWYGWKIHAAGVAIVEREEPEARRGTEIQDWRD